MRWQQLAPKSGEITYNATEISVPYQYLMCLEGNEPSYDNGLDSSFHTGLERVVFLWCKENLPVLRVFPLSETEEIYLGLEDIQIVDKGDDEHFEVSVTYKTTASGPQSTNFCTINFSTTGATVRKYKANRRKNYCKESGSNIVGGPNEYRDVALGLSDSGIEGMTLPSRSLKFSITDYILGFDINFAFIVAHYESTALVNSEPYLSFPPGTLIFYGIQGSGHPFQFVSVQYDFEAAPNIVNKPDPPFDVLTADGWDVVEYTQLKALNNGDGDERIVDEPKERRVLQVFERFDFNSLPLDCAGVGNG
jgi:hypothetical protein